MAPLPLTAIEIQPYRSFPAAGAFGCSESAQEPGGCDPIGKDASRLATRFTTRLSLAALTLLIPSGCASIISGRRADVAINSSPEDARLVVRDKQGRTVATATTPAVVSLKRGDGLFKKAEYTATIEKPGYTTAHVPIESRVNPWLFGNVLFGGVIGLAIDPYTGAMWRPSPGEINEELAPSNRPGPDLLPASHTEAAP